MRSVAVVLLAVLLAAIGGIARADQPAGERELAVANHASQAINEIYVSASSAEHWGDDRLGEATLPPGQTARIKLGRARDCEFDVQVVYEDGGREESKGLNVCRTHALAFDGSGATAPAQAPSHDVSIANRSGRPIQQVLISPADAGDWGEDRLGNASISVGEAATVPYRGDCVADIRVVFDNLGAEERRGVDICASRRIAVQPGWTTADAVPTEARPGEEMLQLSVSNHTGHRIERLYLFPDGNPQHGPELLGSAGLVAGGSVTIAFARPDATCRFAAHAAFAADQPTEDFAGFDLCRSPDLVLPPRP